MASSLRARLPDRHGPVGPADPAVGAPAPPGRCPPAL